MKCIDPNMKKLVSLYQFNQLDEDDKIRVEAHLLECDVCFQEIYRLSPVVEKMLEIPDCYTGSLRPRMSLSNQIRQFLNKVSEMMKREIASIKYLALELWKKPASKIFLPVTVIAMALLCVFYLPVLKTNLDFSVQDNASYLSNKLRGIYNSFGETENLMSHGIKEFQEEHYKEAIPSLKTNVQRKKSDPYGHFYLGVSLVHTGEYKKGIDHLKIANSLCQKQGKELLLEKCYWYLGNAYLKINDNDKAVTEFYKIVEIGGEYAEQAKNQIMLINEQGIK